MPIRSLLILFMSVCSFQANAYLSSDFDVNAGFTSFGINVGDNIQRSLESMSTIEIGYNLIFVGADMAFNFSFQEILQSEFGSLPYTRIALGPRWFPRGLNGRRVILDNQVQGRIWRPSPFIGLQVGLSNLSIQDNTDSQLTNDFNAAMFDANVEIGVETPITSDWLLVGQFAYVVSILGETGDQRPEISYSGIQIFMGLKFTSF